MNDDCFRKRALPIGEGLKSSLRSANKVGSASRDNVGIIRSLLIPLRLEIPKATIGKVNLCPIYDAYIVRQVLRAVE